MKTLYVKDIQKNQVFEGESFAINQINKSTDKTGKPFYSLILADKTGTIPAKIWSDKHANINHNLLVPERIIKISAKVEEYKGSLQLNVLSVDEVDETQLDEFIASSKYDANEMYAELLSYLDKIKNAKLKAVVKKILNDDEIQRKFKFWPAGNSIHHGFRSGLIQHVLEMYAIAESLKRFFPELNYDVLYAGIFLHDIGKLDELSGGLSSNYTQSGGLLGHISIGMNLFLKFGEELPSEIKNHVVHLILSHHGKLEFGSPIVPSTPEAVALHYIDGLSSKIRAALTIVEQIPSESEFSTPSFFLEGARFWKKHNLEVNDEDNSNSDLEDYDKVSQLTLD